MQLADPSFVELLSTPAAVTPSLANQNLNLSLLFKQNFKNFHNFSNIHRYIRVPVRKQGCSSWDQTGFSTPRRSGADTCWRGVWIFVVADRLFESWNGFPNLLFRIGWALHFLSVSIVFELPHVFAVSCSDILCFLFLHVWRSSAARVRTFCTFVCTLFLVCSWFPFLLP